jgi:hypothetical protein
MRRTWTQVFTIVALLLLVNLAFAPPIDKNRPLQEQIPALRQRNMAPQTIQEAESTMLKNLARRSHEPQFDSDPERQVNIDDFLFNLLADVAEKAVRWESTRLADAVANFPARSPGVKTAKAHALGVFTVAVESAVPFLAECLSDSNAGVQKEASATLVRWGREWDKAIKVIYNNDNYLPLAESKDSRAPDACRFGTQNGSFEGRMAAAWALQAFGDSTTLIEVSKYVIENAPVNDPTDNSLARAKYTAIRTLVRNGQLDDIAALSRLASDSAELVRIESVDAIGYAASQGNVAAYDALQSIAEFSVDKKVRVTARDLLNQINKLRDEKK